MHSSCLALAATWISGLCCLLESHWSCAWINASNLLGSLLVYGASATASHCTQRGSKLQPQPSRGPKSLGSPSFYPLYTCCMSSFLVTAPKECSHHPSALCMLVSSSFPQLYDILTLSPPPRGIYIPLHHCLYCSVHWQAQGCPDPPYRPDSCFWPSNKWPSLWKRHFFMACLT